MQLAWFSPMPPVRSGIATCSEELVEALRSGGLGIDVFVDEPVARTAPGTRSAHDFVWIHRQRPYDLTVYQLGNSSHHDFLWPYLLRYPGLAVLHDTHLHHARAAALLRVKRVDDYRAEFAANHPDASPDVAELAVRGFDSHLYYSWPMIRLAVEASRMAAVHSAPGAEALRAEMPGARIEAIRLGHGTAVSESGAAEARRRVRHARGIPSSAVLFGVFGGLSPEKRIPQILDAFASLLPSAPDAWLLMGGGAPEHYDPAADIRARGLESRVLTTGYLPSTEALTDHIAACDATLNLRWPTAGETSGPWLRCLAAGKPTVIIDLLQTADVPSLDPRTWKSYASGERLRPERPFDRAQGRPEPVEGRGAKPPSESERESSAAASAKVRAGSAGGGAPAQMEMWGPASSEKCGQEADSQDPVTIAIDLLDEDHSLRVAMRRLAQDAGLRAALGRAAREYWQRNHTIDAMVEDYRRLLPLAAEAVPVLRPDQPGLPRHLMGYGQETLDAVLERFGVHVGWSRL